MQKQSPFLRPLLPKNERQARTLILTVSVIVFFAVALLAKIKVQVDLPFNIHIFATINAVINTAVAVLLVAGLVAVRRRAFVVHRNIMMTAIVLSFFFLLTYIAHHLLAGEAFFGDANHNGMVDAAEKAAVGSMRTVYLVLLITHIILAAIILPFILFTAYRALTGDYDRHKKLARYTWPLWFYVSVTGPVIYLLISPYYR